MSLPPLKDKLFQLLSESLEVDAPQESWECISDFINATWGYKGPFPPAGEQQSCIWGVVARAVVTKKDFETGMACSIRYQLPKPEQDITRVIVLMFKIVQEANGGLAPAGTVPIFPLVKQLSANTDDPVNEEYVRFLLRKLALCRDLGVSGSYKVPETVQGKQKVFESLHSYNRLLGHANWHNEDASWFMGDKAMLAAVYLYEKHAILTALLRQLALSNKESRRDRELRAELSVHITRFEQCCEYCRTVECAPGVMFATVYNVPAPAKLRAKLNRTVEESDLPPPYTPGSNVFSGLKEKFFRKS